MNALQELWRNNPYAVAAAVIAPIVFAIVFVAIWMLTSGGGDPVATAQVEPADNTPTPAVVQVQSEPQAQQQAEASPTQSREPSAQTESTDTPQAAETPQGAESNEQQAAPSTDEQAPESEPMPELDDVLVAEIDESTFRYGLEEERGAILPITNGVVPSSGSKHTTSWELLLPTARIRADIVSLGRTPRGSVGAPDNPFVVGWFNLSASPGEPGNAILAGHRDYEDVDGNIGPGVCWELDRVSVGDQVVIRDAEQNIAWVYEITERVVVDASNPAANRYLAETDESIITLITCTGSFDPKNHTYSHRLVVIAQLQATAST